MFLHMDSLYIETWDLVGYSNRAHNITPAPDAINLLGGPAKLTLEEDKTILGRIPFWLAERKWKTRKRVRVIVWSGRNPEHEQSTLH